MGAKTCCFVPPPLAPLWPPCAKSSLGPIVEGHLTLFSHPTPSKAAKPNSDNSPLLKTQPVSGRVAASFRGAGSGRHPVRAKGGLRGGQKGAREARAAGRGQRGGQALHEALELVPKPIITFTTSTPYFCFPFLTPPGVCWPPCPLTPLGTPLMVGIALIWFFLLDCIENRCLRVTCRPPWVCWGAISTWPKP